MRSLVAILAVAFASPAPARAPDPAACPPAEQPEGWHRERVAPLAVPVELRSVLATSLLHLAVSTLRGGTICVVTSWMERVNDMALTPDGRFLSFGWLGYESYGHVVVDRTGAGQVLETGVAPVFSPSRRHFASADQTESEFGSLSGLAVWRVDPVGTTEIGRIDELPRMHDWRIDAWRGESCIELSAVALDLPPDESSRQRRFRYRAEPGTRGWHIIRDDRGCAAPGVG